jgi:hypothetical protein
MTGRCRVSGGMCRQSARAHHHPIELRLVIAHPGGIAVYVSPPTVRCRHHDDRVEVPP